MNRHMTREQYHLKMLEMFPPFIIERLGTVPCPLSAEVCSDRECAGWTARHQTLFDDGSLTPEDWQTWERFVEIGW